MEKISLISVPCPFIFAASMFAQQQNLLGVEILPWKAPKLYKYQGSENHLNVKVRCNASNKIRLIWAKDILSDFFLFQLPTAMSRFGMKGQSNTSGVCVEFCVHRTAAVSPAFELRDYTSTEFSTWAESMWVNCCDITFSYSAPLTKNFNVVVTLLQSSPWQSIAPTRRMID